MFERKATNSSALVRQLVKTWVNQQNEMPSCNATIKIMILKRFSNFLKVMKMKKDEKEIRMNIRINRELREEFQAICKQKAMNGSELIRQFVQKWVNKNKSK